MHDEELRQKIESVLPEGWQFKDFIDSPVKYDGGFEVTCPLDDRLGKAYNEKINAICEAMNAICDGGGWGCGSEIYTNYFYLKKEKPMNAEQEEGPDAAMDVAMDNNEVGDPEEPLLLLPNFWSEEEKDGVRKMLNDEDTSLKKMAYKIVERWGGFRDWQRNDMCVHETGRDKYGTFVFKVWGGRNYCLSQNAPYYFSQLSTMMMFAKNCGVKTWPLNIKFDVADDLWDAEFGIDFNKGYENTPWLLRGAKMIGFVEEEAIPEEEEAIPAEESATIE